MKNVDSPTPETVETTTEIKPDFYYENGGVPVFKPTMEQFQDFQQFVTRIDKYGQQSGIVKIIPPKEWKDTAGSISEEKLNNIRISSAIKQTFIGQNGQFTQINTPFRKKLTIKEWKDLCYSDEYKTPSILDRKAKISILPIKRKLKQEKKESMEEKKENVDMKEESHADLDVLADDTEKIYSLTELLPYASQQKSPDFYRELERVYWKNLSFGDTIYGADIEGSLFDENMNIWNVSRLDNVLNRMNKRVPGVNTPYLYFGMYKSTFSWHVEDMDLYSINYIHYGAPKQWFVIPPANSSRFEDLAKSIYPEIARSCPQFLRHKMCLISPSRISGSSIPVHRCVQEEGEFIITFPHGYHSGYNVGYNCAESINFALERWIEIGKKAQTCKCVSHSVIIDVAAIFEGKKPSSNDEIVENRRRCALCGKPEDDVNLIPLADLHVDQTIETKKKSAHLSCARAIPELLVREDNIAIGYSLIPASRRALNCRFCDFKNGACIQCSSEKCYVSYHVTCALENGLSTEMKTSMDGIQYCESFCSRHDKNYKKFKRKKLNEHLLDVCDDIDTGKDIVWTKWIDGNYYKGKLIQDFRKKQVCKVAFYDVRG